ncbi:MAG: hypothetical protein U5N58_06480 [Actinomycetota bacterium]|nr:hypothetical protein [Actinomycetota bacterium]
MKKKCVDDLKLLKGEVEYCFECDCFPCESLAKLDKKYREGYAMSQIENLIEIKSKGIDSFIVSQEEKYTCAELRQIDLNSQWQMLCLPQGKKLEILKSGLSGPRRVKRH